MPLDAIEQKAKSILEAAYKLKQQKKKKEINETKEYIRTLADSIAKDVEEEKKQLAK